jgi:hypothetical protein
MTATALLIQFGIPALAFLVGHLGVLPAILSGLKPGTPATPPSPFPTTIGHGEVINWLLTQLVQQQPVPQPVPVAPVAPSAGVALLTEIKTLLATFLQQSLSQPAIPAAPVVAPVKAA